MDIEVFLKGNKVTETEKKLLIYIFENIADLDGISVREIARINYTSASSVIRLAQKLGFSGYIDLFYYLKNNTENMEPILTENKNFSLEIEKLKSLYYPKPNKFILIYASGFSAIIAEYLYKKLLVKGVKVIFSSAKDSSGVIENNIESFSLCFIISKSGETLKLIEKIKILRIHQIPIVLFTGNEASTATYFSDISFVLNDSNPLDTHNKDYNLFFGNLVMLIEKIVYDLFS